MKGTVGIFRLHLFKYSEPFVVNQAECLTRYEPIYLGRKIVGSPPESRRIIARDSASPVDVARMVLFRDPQWTKELGGIKLDLLHAHFGIDGVYALPLAKRLGIPLVTTLHGIDATLSTSSLLSSVRPALINYAILRNHLYQYSSYFICVSNFIRQAALKKGVPPEKLVVHYIGIDVETLRPRGDAGEDGLIVHVGRLVEVKGATYLLKAMARIKSAHKRARLLMIGDGPLKGPLAKEAAELELGSSVQFLGALSNEETLSWMRRAAVLVVPSITMANGYAEALGMVNLEAGSQGVPVVASASGGISEAISDGETGFLVPERSADALAERISLLLSNADLRVRMGEAGRRIMEKKFDIRKQSQALERLYGDASKQSWIK